MAPLRGFVDLFGGASGGFRVQGFGFRVSGLGFGVWVLGFGFGVWGLGLRVIPPANTPRQVDVTG